jgi:hypothetical protein
VRTADSCEIGIATIGVTLWASVPVRSSLAGILARSLLATASPTLPVRVGNAVAGCFGEVPFSIG